MTTKNISGSEMNPGIYEQNKLIDTLKGIIGGFSSKNETSIEKIVSKYLNFNFLPLQQVKSTGNVVFFVNKLGKSKIQYLPENKVLRMPGYEFLEIKEMFDIDEDFLEEIIKSWMKENFDVDISFINYYY
jgi:hypothetical protein